MSERLLPGLWRPRARQFLTHLCRYSPLFTALRDTSKLEGKGGVCEFREISGGSRAGPMHSPETSLPKSTAVSGNQKPRSTVMVQIGVERSIRTHKVRRAVPLALEQG